MRIAVRITLIYAALVAILGVVARMDSLAFCSGACQPISFSSAIAYFLLILPGLKTIGLLVPYHVQESSVLSLLREALSFIATALALFSVVLLIERAVSRARGRRQA
jgi:hypothetical protein